MSFRAALKGFAMLAGLVVAGFLVKATGLSALLEKEWLDTLVRGGGYADKILFLAVGGLWTAVGLPRQARRQIEAGVDAVQVFDSWVGALTPDDYRELAMPHTARILEAAKATGVPVIHFGTGTATLLETMATAGGDVIGADWRIPLDDAWELIGPDRAIQGNLDPTLLLGPMERMMDGADDVLRRAAGRPGHIFNLGHGILPETPVENVQALAHFVHGQG